MQQDDITIDNDFVTPDAEPVQTIKVIGVGGGGNNAVLHMHKHGIKGVSYILLNTDKQVLDSMNFPNKVLIGPGRGAGGKPEVARKFAEENAERIAELFDDHTDMVFITAGMGGGTGTGAAPVVARIAKERGILTVGIVTVPFLFEGKLKIIKALEGAEEMAKNVDSLLVINNQRLSEIYQSLDIFNAFAKADDTLLTAAKSITDIITYKGIINRDFNDIASTLRDGGTAIISSGYGEGPHRVTSAIQDALHSPLLKNTDIFSSKKLLMVLHISNNPAEHPFNMEETNELTEFIARNRADVDVMWGLYADPELEDRVRITLLASGFDMSIDSDGPKITPKPATDNRGDKLIEDTYGAGVSGSGDAIVLNPDDYDNPNTENMAQLEETPAIYRRGYGLSTPIPPLKSASQRNNTEKPAARPDEGDNNGTLINFDDLT